MYKRIALIASREDLYDVQDELIDRYGRDPRRKRRTCLDIALIKAEASHAHIAQLSVRDGEVRFTFDKDAPMNGQKLLKPRRDPGAQFLNGEVPAISVRMPRADAEKLCGMLPQFVYTLADCIEAN